MLQSGGCRSTCLLKSTMCQNQLSGTGQGINVSLDTKVGVETLFTECEEQQMVDHVKYMASIGYEYNKSGG